MKAHEKFEVGKLYRYVGPDHLHGKFNLYHGPDLVHVNVDAFIRINVDAWFVVLETGEPENINPDLRAKLLENRHPMKILLSDGSVGWITFTRKYWEKV